jgi:[ribosomal protein S5]-alanine N-acetyltransferase
LSRAYLFTTPRLGFACWSKSDLPLATVLWGNFEVTRYLGGPFSRDQIQEKLNQEIAWMSEHGIQYWPIFLRANDEFIGCSGLRPYNLGECIYELGFHLCPEVWGRGLATEAGRAAIAYGFDTIGAKSLFAGHHPENAVSRKVLGKLGFRYTHDEIYPVTGELHPSYLLECGARASHARS